MKNKLLISCVIYTVFVVYGSLVPWQFNSLSLSDAWYRFQNIQYYNQGISSKSDWATNILLFIPLAFLWLSAISFEQQLVGRCLSSILVLIASFLLCSTIEFTQLFFPPRTASLNDIVAESIGAVIGVLAWWIFGRKFIIWLEAWQINKTRSISYLQIYLGGMFFYNVMPLDLSLSPIEFYHKWHEGRVILWPFSGLKGDIFRDVYDCLSDIVLWLPVPWLWHKFKILSNRELLLRVFLSAGVIEFFQLFVYSRVTDVTDIFLAFVGGLIGVRLMAISSSGFAVGGKNSNLKGYQSSNILYPYIIFLFWAVVVYCVFLYPYDFEWSYSRLSVWRDKFFIVPFYAYYFGTEYRAITEIFHKVLFFIPFGVICGYVLWSGSKNSPKTVIALAPIVITAIGVEFGQLFLPNKNVDVTDVILEVLGGYLGYAVTRHLNIARSSFNESNYNAKNDAVVVGSRLKAISPKDSGPKFLLQSDTNWSVRFLPTVGAVFLIFGSFLFISSSESVPYNVRELFAKEYPAISALGLTVLIYWVFAYPLLALFNMLKKEKFDVFCCVQFLAMHSLVAWILLRAIVPLESIHDILGSPILSIPAELELVLRFLALFGIYSLIMLAATHTALIFVVSSRILVRLFVMHVFWSSLLLPLGYWGWWSKLRPIILLS
ncbi:VanZ family protein [Methylomonas albis]|uniref:VanZ family protein n=1 Tax=Methylomonas albis TaxID=1854563 RepID=A0ABR9D4M5_9GAMM|nr:VanZ family protein [Methylomonas albis]MBD9357746.1 VanZ family protein [Methylomonas albis]